MLPHPPLTALAVQLPDEALRIILRSRKKLDGTPMSTSERVARVCTLHGVGRERQQMEQHGASICEQADVTPPERLKLVISSCAEPAMECCADQPAEMRVK